MVNVPKSQLNCFGFTEIESYCQISLMLFIHNTTVKQKKKNQ